MFSTKLRTTIATLAAVFAVAVPLVAAGPAGAEPKQGGSTAKGCPVEDEHGNVSYVEVGTRIGLFVCGSDGNWHFGWLINGRVAPPSTPTKGTVAGPVRVSRLP